MIKEYKTLSGSIEKEIANYYQKYGVDQVVEYRTLVQAMDSADRNLLYKDFDSFAAAHPDLKRLLPVRESIYKLNRLEGLQLSVQMKQYGSGSIEQAEMEKVLQQAYEKGYLSTMKGLENTGSFFGINESVMKATVNTQWINGENYSDRIWKNKNALINSLNTDLRNGVIRGDTYDDIVRQIRQRNDVNISNAKRLVATESAFVMNQANMQAFMSAGIKRYEWCSVMDSRTSQVCKDLDGEVFEFDKAQVGANYPPMHSWCRSTVVPVENNSAKAQASELIDEAKEHESQVTSDLSSIANEIGTKLEGLDFRMKSLSSLTRKISNEPEAKMRDVLRYTNVSDSENTVKDFNRCVDKFEGRGYNISAVKNYWNNPDNPYNGINANFITSDNYEFELQFHTPESFELKNGKLHELYEKFRVSDSADEKASLTNEMFKLSDGLRVPKDITQVR